MITRPLQLDFGEAGEEKSVVVVDADPGRPTRVEVVPLHAGRRLEDFTGTLEELRADAVRIGDAFVRAVLISDEPIRDLAAAAKEAAPQATFVAIDPRCAASQVMVLEPGNAEDREPDLEDLFREYLDGRVPGGAVAADILESFTALLADATSETPGTFGEEARLLEVLGEDPGRHPDRAVLLPAGPAARAAADSVDEISSYAAALAQADKTVTASLSQAAKAAAAAACTQLERLHVTAGRLKAGKAGLPVIALPEGDDLLKPSSLDALVSAQTTARDDASRHQAE